MISVKSLAAKPQVAKIITGNYNFETQQREMPEGSYPTWGTAQTFDYKGTPVDQRSDTDG